MSELVLSAADAQRLDSRIRLMVTSIGESLSKLYGLVEQAKAGGVHTALGYPSWTAYVADACKVNIRLDREQRRELVGWLSDEGMSTRAIASTIGVSKNTVTADLSQTGTPDVGDLQEEKDYFSDSAEASDCLTMANVPDDVFEAALTAAREQADMSRDNVADICRGQKITGLDGNTYTTPVKLKEPRRRPLVSDASSIAHDMRRLHSRINKLLGDDRFDANREQIGDAMRPYSEWLFAAAERLHTAIEQAVDQ